MESTSKFLIVVVVILCMTLGSLNIAYAITNGKPDGDGHPYVGLVVFDVGGTPAWYCSGALISQTVFLTAGHCTDGADAARVWFESNVTDPNYPYGGGTSIEAKEIHTHPAFCIGCGHGTPGFDTNDVGVVILNNPVSGKGSAALPTEGLVDTLAMKTPVTLVGYGAQWQTRGSPPHLWEGPEIRLFAPSLLIQSKNVQSDEYIKLTANPAQGKGGICFGDSGGPDLLGDTILAVNSYVNNYNCTGITYSNRIDTANVLDFIKGFLP